MSTASATRVSAVLSGTPALSIMEKLRAKRASRERSMMVPTMGSLSCQRCQVSLPRGLATQRRQPNTMPDRMASSSHQ
ncbi:hypothetical protein D3C76_1088410 [compost metagenome]